jgi:D-glycero-beta-D-manno-heptose-7-phosphate kinase
MSNILVVGDSCRDVFVYCTCDRLAPEFPVQILNSGAEILNGGMAKNVQCNIKALDFECDILTNSNWKDITKTRYIDKDTNYMFIRVDSPHEVDRINFSDHNIKWDDYDAVVISDYDKGFLHSEDINYICQNHSNTFIDTKKPLISEHWINTVKFIKINHQEYVASKSIIESNNKLYDKMIRTMGPHGAFYRDQQFKVDAVDVKDVSGAGDSFLAGLVSQYIKSEDINAAIHFANECATTVVQKRGVSVV